MIIECAELLGSSYKNEFFADSLNYRAVETFSIEGTILGDLSKIWDTINVSHGSYLGPSELITINGFNMGSGIVRSIDYISDIDVNQKKFNIEIDFFRSGSPLTSLHHSEGFYNHLSGVYDAISSGHIYNISEDFIYSNVNSGQYDFNRSLSFSILSGYGFDRTSVAKSIAFQTFQNSNTLPFVLAQYPAFYSQDEGVRSIQESYDVINGVYSFNESFRYHSGLNYLWDYSHAVNFSDGIHSVTENGEILSTKKLATKIGSAETGWAAIRTGLFNRVSGFFNYFSGECPLNTTPSKQSITRIPGEGRIQYDYSYDTDQRKLNGVMHEKEISFQYGNGFNSLTENGSILPIIRSNSGDFTGILNYYQGYKSTISGNIYSGAYQRAFNLFETGCQNPGTLSCLSSSETFNEWAASINYNFSFSDSPEYLNSGNVFRFSKSIKDSAPVHLTAYFEILNEGIISQGSNQSTLGNYSNSIQVIGTSGSTLSGLLNYAVNNITTPTGVLDFYVNSASYSYEPFDQALSFDISYDYSKYRNLTNIIV